MSGRIASIEAFEIAIPLARELRLGAMVIKQREYTVVRVRDETGCCGTTVGLTRGAPVAATVRRCVTPHLLDQPLARYAERYGATVRANVTLGTNGIFWRAISLADCAIHDLLAIRAGLPLHAYLGAPEPQPSKPMLVGGYPSPDETQQSLKDQVRRMLDLGAGGIKIGSSGNFAHDTRRLAVCRAAAPDGPPLMIDLYWQCTHADGLMQHARDWAEFDMGWIEDPFLFDDYANSARLSESIRYPLAVGDEQCGLAHFQRMMDQGKIGVVRLDATVCGGIGAFRSISRAAAERGLPVSCHVFPHLHVHLAAVEPNVCWVEMFLPDLELDPISAVWHSDPMPLCDGSLTPSLRLGIGYDWDEAALQQYRTEEPNGHH